MPVFQNDMNNEFKRYATFNGFRGPEGVWPLQLAQAGFYRSASCEEFQVVCFSCGLKLDLRNVNRDPVIEIHRRLSSKCAFVNGSSNNQPVPQVDSSTVEWLRQNFPLDCEGPDSTHQNDPPSTQPNESVRNETVEFDEAMLASIEPLFPQMFSLNTLEQSDSESELPSLPMDFVDGFANTTLNSVPTAQLFQSGATATNSPSFTPLPFSHFGSSSLGGPQDIVVTDGVSEGQTGSYPAPSMSDSEISSYSNHTQQYSEQLGEDILMDKLTYGDLGIVTQRPKRPEFAPLQKRLETFNHWMGPSISQTREEIAEAGFYYAGYSDCCRCFYCGGGLKSWEKEDNAWIEHARWFKSCPFILTNKGKEFIEAVDSLARTNSSISLSDVETEMKRVMSVQLPRPHAEVNSWSTQEVDMEPEQTLVEDSSIACEAERLSDENLSLRRPELCKICMDAEVSIVYVPCGHLVTCGTCASTVKTCPVCRKSIGGQIRIQRSDG